MIANSDEDGRYQISPDESVQFPQLTEEQRKAAQAILTLWADRYE